VELNHTYQRYRQTPKHHTDSPRPFGRSYNLYSWCFNWNWRFLDKRIRLRY